LRSPNHARGQSPVLGWGGKQNWEKETKQYTNKTSIKRVASISPLKIGGLVAKPQPPEAMEVWGRKRISYRSVA